MSLFRMAKSSLLLLWVLLVVFNFASCKKTPINAIRDSHFTADGHLKPDSTCFYFQEERCSALKLYVESSGSMNGFFRSNKATQFKEDVWCIFSDFEKLTDEVIAFEGKNIRTFRLKEFEKVMASGQLRSSQSTMVPEMLQNIVNNLDYNHGEAAVLVSDMKYSPAGQATMPVLLSLYSTNIRNLVMNTKAAFALVAATSNYVDNYGVEVEAESPYYYLIIGKPQQVTWLRNCISTLLKDQNRYVDAVEYGFDYGTPMYQLGKVQNGIKKKNEPTVYRVNTNSKQYKGSCFIDLEIDITGYPWFMENEEVLRNAIELESVTGSVVEIESVEYRIDNHADKSLRRRAKAIATLKISRLSKKGDVIKWYLNVPEGIISSRFHSFFGATSETVLNQSFSIENFISGMSSGKANFCSKNPHRILVSTAK